MDNSQQFGRTTVLDAQTTGLSWSAVVAGAVTAAALTLLLIAFGAGLGLSAVSPWSGSGISASTFKFGTGIYLLVVAVMASALGGYLAARLRAPWTGIHTNEVFFRDTAHGLLSWAFATILSATALGAITSNIVAAQRERSERAPRKWGRRSVRWTLPLTICSAPTLQPHRQRGRHRVRTPRAPKSGGS
jgi:hypothetical protein